MRNKHKKKSHPWPIVPKHTTASRATAGSGFAQQQSQQQLPGHEEVAAANGNAQHRHGGSLLGKREQSAHHQVDHVATQHHKKTKLQKQPQQQQSLQKLDQQQQQRQGRQQDLYQQQSPQQQQQQETVERHEHIKQHVQHDKRQPQKQKQQQHPSKKRKHKQLAAAAAPAVEVDAVASKPPLPNAGSDAAAPNATADAAAAVPTVNAKPWHPKQPTAVGSNWQALQQQLKQQAATKPRRPRKQQAAAGGSSDAAAGKGSSSKQIGAIGHNKSVTPVIAMDCEMVGVGPGGERDSLARVSIVNASGHALYDSYVAQKEPVTDYRTWVSGITPANLQGAPDISQVQGDVTELLQGRVLVGHGLKKDLSVLMLSHPRKNMRDTAKYPPFMFSKGGKRRPRALKVLTQQELGINIQEGQHSSVDDARAALYLYQKHAASWEKALKTPQGIKQLPTANRPVKRKRVERYSLRDVKDDPLADL